MDPDLCRRYGAANGPRLVRAELSRRTNRLAVRLGTRRLFVADRESAKPRADLHRARQQRWAQCAIPTRRGRRDLVDLRHAVPPAFRALRLNLVLARATLFGFFITLFPAVASADWIYAPFVGATFGGSTTLLDLEFGGASSTQLIFGGSVGWWSAGIIGFETDFSYAPRFFETDNQTGLVTNSNLITWGGNVVVAVPVSITRESLRPYLVGGLGWMHASIDEGSNVFPEFLARARNSVGLNIGGGAIGFISQRTGLRFEVRHFRSLEHGENPVSLESGSLLSFWRATVGVVVRR